MSAALRGVPAASTIATALAVLFSVAGCSKSVEQYLTSNSDREQMMLKCYADNSNFKSGDCANALAASEAVEKAQRAKVAAEQERERAKRLVEQERERVAAAEKKAQELVKVNEAKAKYKVIEDSEKAAYDLGEGKLSKFTPQVVNQMLTEMASALNQGKTDAAAAAMRVSLLQIAAYQQGATGLLGIKAMDVDKFEVRPPQFSFTLQPVGYGIEPVVPTGYQTTSKNSEISVGFRTSYSKSVYCSGYGTLTLKLDKATGEVTGDLRGNVPAASDCR